ncbi:GGDEF domain-containing protein [Anaeromicrobium sediminis]|uniref:GGDEF domain-containing protein n=1 Tax=Anaeromicrobium sediminis TaxID=1478221 RepID=A0A267MCZ2_9FIRM|nr:GGDEF domain-containing protein [Anaeromicrobium sediminis]PAB56735.1 hypothetical protein CCE28_20515 [Anaeromicrobium sediminis]
MEVHRIKRQRTLELVIISFLIALVMFMTIYFFMVNKFNESQEEFLEFLSSSLKVSIEENYKFAYYNESDIEEDLYYRLKDLSIDMKNIPLKDIDLKMLNKYKKKYDLSQLAILEKKKDGKVYISKSTVAAEVGADTSSWGYWNDAFIQLFGMGSVSINKGYGKEDYWVGPKSYLYNEFRKTGRKHYYKFAYYLNEEQNYLINGIIDEEKYSYDGAERLNKLLNQYSEKVNSIEMIGIIDKDNWITYKEPKRKLTYDPIMEFGNLKGKDFISFGIEPAILSNLEKVKFHPVKYNEKNYKLAFIPLDKHKVICALVKKGYFEDNEILFIIIGIVLSLFVSLITSIIINKEQVKYNKILNMEKDRLNTIEQFKDALLNVPDYVFRCKQRTDKSFYIVYNDGRLVKEKNYVSQDMEPKSMEEVYSNKFIQKASEPLQKAFNNEKISYEYENNNKFYEVILIPVSKDKGKGEDREVLGFVNDVTKYVDMSRKSSYMAYHDELTGLYNRHSFNNDFNKIKDENGNFGIYYLDLDGFKEVNDNYGHKIGDKVLRQISDRLKSINEKDRLYRIGGDEFIVITKRNNMDEHKDIATKTIAAIKKTVKVDEIEIRVGVSIGIALYPQDGQDKEELINVADKAMYEAKRQGKNTYYIGRVS